MHAVFLPRRHVEAVNAKAAAGEAPWAEAVAQLLAAGEAALEQPPLSIRANGGSKHFRQDAVYVPGEDGVVNEAANRKSGALAGKLSSTCMDLAMCWRLTGEGRYAEKALQLAHAWCLDRATYMFPEGRVDDPWTPGAEYGGDVVLFGAFHNFFLACYLLDDYPGWAPRAHAATRRWIRAMVEPQRPTIFHDGVEMYNNWDDARCIYLLNGALALDDLDLVVEVFERWAHTLPLKMTDDGFLPRETMRTRSMPYTLAALSHTLHIAHVAERFGAGLLDLSVNGKTIRTVVDTTAYYLLHMDEWPYEMITPMSAERGNGRIGQVFEIAHRRWREATYLEVLDAWGGRPCGRNTLLYASADEA